MDRIESALECCLRSCGISLQDYTDLTDALARISRRSHAADTSYRYDNTGVAFPYASISRMFDRCTIVAEDRGPVYAVWVKSTHADGGLREVLFFAELAW